MSDKPATATLAEARELAGVVAAAARPYRLTFTYTGYPMVREARARVAAGEIGRVRKVVVEYFQGWLSERVEDQGSKQAAWRVDPAQAGLGGCIGDIGVHAFNLAEFVTGDRVAAINPDLAAVVEGREANRRLLGLQAQPPRAGRAVALQGEAQVCRGKLSFRLTFPYSTS